ncbi:MAG: SDR family oxidoreductase [Bacteroidota bacterium]
MRILITGHDGYIGTVMAPALRTAGHDVHGLDADLFSACAFGPQPPAIPSRQRDLREATPDDLAGFDAVVHLANLSNDPLGNLDPDLTYAINHRATVRLGELAREAGVERFVFASSCSLYGAAGQDAVDETAPFNPVTPYGEAKVLAERDLKALETDSFAPVFMRNATVYGVSPRLRFDLVVNNLTAWAVATGQVRMKSDGSPWRPLVHVRDVCSAFLAALEAPTEAVSGKAFNVGSDAENYRIREVAEIVGEEVDGTEVTFASGASPDTRSYRAGFGKIERVLGWTAERTVRDGVREVRDALSDLGLQPDDFEGPRYSRIAHLNALLGSGRLGADLRWTGASSTDTARGVSAPDAPEPAFA